MRLLIKIRFKSLFAMLCEKYLKFNESGYEIIHSFTVPIPSAVTCETQSVVLDILIISLHEINFYFGYTNR